MSCDKFSTKFFDDNAFYVRALLTCVMYHCFCALHKLLYTANLFTQYNMYSYCNYNSFPLRCVRVLRHAFIIVFSFVGICVLYMYTNAIDMHCAFTFDRLITTLRL